MPRTHLPRRVAAMLGTLALLASVLAPLAPPAQAAPPGQLSDDEISQVMAGIIVSIDEPTHRSGVTSRRVLVRGWAANPASQRGTGVSRVDLYLDGGPDEGGFYLGRANYGIERPDVAAALGGQRFLPSGFELVVDIPRGPHTIVAVAAPTGTEPALVVPGVASVHATVGGPAGRTAPGCGAGGYCTSDEGGETTGNLRPAWLTQPLYHGNLYVGSGAFGQGPTTPPYGWWDDYQDQMGLYSLFYRTYAYPYPQWFFGHVPLLYNQNLLTTLSTQGALAIPLSACVGPQLGGLGILGLSVLGGYSFGFPLLPGIGTTLNGTGTFGQPTAYNGPPAVLGSPISIPLTGGAGIGQLVAGGFANPYNAPYTTLSRTLGGGAAGPGGAGGASPAAGTALGTIASQAFYSTGCNTPL